VKIIIDIMFNGYIIDAHYVPVVKPGDRQATAVVDLTDCIRDEITKAKARHGYVAAQRKRETAADAEDWRTVDEIDAETTRILQSDPNVETDPFSSQPRNPKPAAQPGLTEMLYHLNLWEGNRLKARLEMCKPTRREGHETFNCDVGDIAPVIPGQPPRDLPPRQNDSSLPARPKK